MILSGPQILKEIEKGSIVIDPFKPEHLNPNSYDLRLAPEMLVYAPSQTPGLCAGTSLHGVLDMRAENPTKEIHIPDEGVILEPGILYLGHTMEYTETHEFVPCIEGRSSAARLGLCTHVSAGFGDVGFCGTWTLEITVVHPLRVYAGIRICQVSFTQLHGERMPYKGKYQGQRRPKPSGLWRDFVGQTNNLKHQEQGNAKVSS